MPEQKVYFMARRYKRKRRPMRRRRRAKRRGRKMIRYKTVGDRKVDYMRLVWCQAYTLDGGVNTPAVRGSITCNGAAIPDTGSATRQCRGWNEITPLYTAWRCLRSRITVQWVQPGDDIVPYVGGVARRVVNVVEGNIRDYIEQRNCVYRICSGSRDKVYKVSMGWSLKKATRTGKSGDWDGSMTANPANLNHFHIFTGALDPVANPPAVVFMVRLEFFCFFRQDSDFEAS